MNPDHGHTTPEDGEGGTLPDGQVQAMRCNSEPMADFGAALLAAREVLDHPDEALSVRRLRGGVTVIRWDAGEAWMEVGLEGEPLALLTDDERARIDRLAGGAL